MKRVLTVVLITFQSVSFAQQQPTTSQVLQNVQQNTVNPKNEKVDFPLGDSFAHFGARYGAPNAPAVPLGPADRARSLVRNGALNLSLHDAIALAIENNLVCQMI